MTTINGRTPEEIKKGLECCNTFNVCHKCPYEKAVDTEHGWGCVVIRNADALAYIQQLERERDELLQKNQQLERERDSAVEILRDLKPCAACDHKGCANCRWFDDVTRRNRDLQDCWQWRSVEVE